MPETGEDTEPLIQSPKSSLNLAGLKAAFSSSNSGYRSNMSKATKSGQGQKTLQSFFKSPGKPPTCNQSVKSPVKTTRDLASCSPVGKSVLDGFRYGRMPCSDTDSTPDSLDATPDSQCSGSELSTPEPEMDTSSVKNETSEDASDKSHTVPEDPEFQTEPHTSTEDCTASPDAKRVKKDNLHSTTESKSNTFSHCSEGSSPSSSSMVMDAPVCIQKRSVPIQFSLQELTEKTRRLQDWQKHRASEELRYRRFRAKINPGENQSAEEELKKEIR